MGAIAIVASIGAPSSLAVQVAKELDIVLVGFLRQQHCNIYQEAEHISGSKGANNEGAYQKKFAAAKSLAINE
jgi:hypothetical protein